MLPDFPELKRRLQEKQVSFISDRVRAHMGILGEIKRFRVREGNRSVLRRADGSEDVTIPKEFSAGITMDLRKIGIHSHKEFMQKLDGIAQELAEKQSRSFFSGLEEVCKKTGNTFDFEGGFSPEKLLEVFEKLEISFNENGVPVLPVLIAGPKAFEVIDKSMKNLDPNGKWAREFDSLIERKRMAWFDRENSRKLVG